MTNPTPQELARLRELAAKATKGPFVADCFNVTAADGSHIAAFAEPDDFPCLDDEERESPELLAELDANLGLYIELRNHADPLISAAERLAVYREEVEAWRAAWSELVKTIIEQREASDKDSDPAHELNRTLRTMDRLYPSSARLATDSLAKEGANGTV